MGSLKKKKLKLIEKWFPGTGGWGKQKEVGKVQTFSCKIMSEEMM